MAKKVNEDTWNAIQKNSQGDYFILGEDNGKVEVEILSPHYVVEQGDEDLAGRIWNNEWAKNEIKALVDEETKIMSLGWATHPFLRTFIAACKKNGVTPDTLEGTRWTMQKTGEYEYKIEYLGRSKNTTSTSSQQQELKTNQDPVETLKSTDVESKVDNGYNKIKETILSLKNEPELAEGKSRGEFIAIIGLKAQIPKRDVEKYFDQIISNNVVSEVNGTIVIN